MATKLERLRDHLIAVLGKPSREHADAVWCLDHRNLRILPFDEDRRQYVAKVCRAAIWGGYRRGAGIGALRRALNRGVELGDAPADVDPELAHLLDELAEIILPHPFD